METPWDMIRAIAMTLTKEWKNIRSVNGWTKEKIAEVARAGVRLKPSLTHGPLTEEDVQVLRVKRRVMECMVCFWVVHHNLNGIVVPAELIVEEYRKQWGLGPHGPLVTQHLDQMMKKKRKEKWLTTFRTKWNLQVGTFPRRPSLTTEDIRKKATSKTHSGKEPFLGREMEQVLRGNWNRPLFHFWVPVLVPKNGPLK